jgi:hypothetical protein
MVSDYDIGHGQRIVLAPENNGRMRVQPPNFRQGVFLISVRGVGAFINVANARRQICAQTCECSVSQCVFPLKCMVRIYEVKKLVHVWDSWDLNGSNVFLKQFQVPE